MTESLHARRGDFIAFSLIKENQIERARSFSRIVGFPMKQGAIDCMCVALRAPRLNAERYHNHKGYRSLNVRLECDHAQHITWVIAQYPGRSNYAFTLHQSTVSSVFEPPRQTKRWLLGDKGKPLIACLMTPPHNPTTHRQHACNVATRNLIEQTIGVLKQCFCCVAHSGGALQDSPERVSRYIVAYGDLQKEKEQVEKEEEVEGEEEEEEEKEEEKETAEEEIEGRRQCRHTLPARAVHDRLIRLWYE
uniref:putative nuclease HARBI1 n=1 Tax=Pristiophorus japonicus TaxID=55135 RepID=UPI00398EB7C2